MNNEIKITVIGCAIVFATIGIFVMNSMNPDQSMPQSEMIGERPQALKSIPDDSMKDLTKYPQTTIIKLDDNLSLKKTIIALSISENNTHPWGTIKGKVSNPAPGYPVVIQFFKSLEGNPIHVAQVDVKDDNSFEYSFRLLSIDEGKTTHFFEGDYYIKIFKTVNTQ